MLGLGINDKNKITIPQKYIVEKIETYKNILTGVVPPPYHFTHKESGALDYWKVLSSIQ